MFFIISHILWTAIVVIIGWFELKFLVNDIKAQDDLWRQKVPLAILLVINTLGWIIALIAGNYFLAMH